MTGHVHAFTERGAQCPPGSGACSSWQENPRWGIGNSTGEDDEIHMFESRYSANGPRARAIDQLERMTATVDSLYCGEAPCVAVK